MAKSIDIQAFQMPQALQGFQPLQALLPLAHGATHPTHAGDAGHVDDVGDACGRRVSRARERAGTACLKAAAVLSAALGLTTPATAYADVDVSGTLTQVLNMLANGITLLGGILVVMGLVALGMSLKDGMRGGSELSGALAMIVGGIVVSAAGAYFRSLPTNITG